MLNAGACATCKCAVWVPDELYHAAKRSEKVGFFCAYGHSLCFPQGETDEQKLRRERDRLVQQAARLEEEASLARVRAEKAERATKRLKKRTSAGTCPCCNRTFGNMDMNILCIKKCCIEVVSFGI